MEYPFKDLLPLGEVLEREGYYKDWTHLDPEVFYSLTQISEYIKTKGYGVDVRLLIAQLAEHFGLKTTQVVDLANLLQQKFTNLEGVTQSFTNNINSLVAQMEADKDAVIANATVDSEVILARGDKPTLGARLDETTAQLDETTEQLAQTTRQEMERENANLISIDNSNHLKHPIDSYSTYRQVKDWNTSDSTDKVFAPVIGKHNGVLYVFWRSASNHVSDDGKIKLKKSTDNGLTWESTERVVLSNTPNVYIYNMNFITTKSGLFTLVFFYRDAQQKVHTAYINSSDFGETWSDPSSLPKPNDVEETAICGAHTIKNGVIYQTGYTLDNRVYIIKSSSDGATWEFVGYVSQTVKMNEASITYVPKDDMFYLVARSAEKIAGVTPYEDYENFMIVGESKDAITWSKFYDIPVYGHAPWTALLSDDKLIVTYANRSRKYNDKLYSCDMVILRKGQPITNTHRFNRSDNFDSYYSGVINDGTYTHIIYYQEQTSLRYHRLTNGQLDLLGRSEAIPAGALNDYVNDSFIQGYWKTNEKYIQSWQLEKIDLNLTSYTVKEFTIKQPLSVRGVFVGAMLQSGDEAKMEILDNFMCEAKFKDATTIRVVIRNMTGSNLVVTGVDLRLFIVGE